MIILKIEKARSVARLEVGAKHEGRKQTGWLEHPQIHTQGNEEPMERYPETETEMETDGDGDGGKGRGRARQTVPVHKVQWRAAGADGSQGEEEAARIGRRWRRVARRDPVRPIIGKEGVLRVRAHAR